MRLKPRVSLSRRVLLGAVAVLLWVGLMFGAAVPAWRESLRRAQEVTTTEAQLAQLNLWSVAGAWMERSLQTREPEVRQCYTTLIPPERAKEQLFLDLARVADRSGIEAFDLIEEEQPATWQMQDPEGGMGGGTPPPDDATDGGLAAAGDALDLPVIPLQQYRVRATFTGDFDEVARFLDGLHEIPRALSVNHLAARSSTDGIEVELELDFYVDESL